MQGKSKKNILKSELHGLHKCEMKLTERLAKMEDYHKILSSVLELSELAHKYSAKLDLEEGVTKKAWETIIADLATMKAEEQDTYTDTAELLVKQKSKIEEKEKEIENA